MSDELDRTDDGLQLAFGTADEGRAWVGRRSGRRTCEDEVTWAAIKHFCGLVRDANPVYWDEKAARSRFAGIPAPPGMLFVWSMPPLWRPDADAEAPTLATRVPLPGNTVINVTTRSEFLEPVLVGDRLSFEEVVSDVTPEKATALGRGHFITTELVYRNARDTLVARHENVLFRYDAAAPTDRAREKATPQNAEAESGGEILPTVELPVTLRLCVHDASATHDYFPGHHDRDYARAQNARDTYLNTMFFHGFVDRVVTDWTGPGGVVRKRLLRMKTPICVGDTIRTYARVVDRRVEEGRAIADVAVEVRSEHGVGAEAVVTCTNPPPPSVEP